MTKDSYPNLVRAWRLRRHVSQETLAHQVGVTRQTIVNIEQGHNEPNVYLALRIAQWLDQPIVKLFPMNGRG